MLPSFLISEKCPGSIIQVAGPQRPALKSLADALRRPVGTQTTIVLVTNLKKALRAGPVKANLVASNLVQNPPDRKSTRLNSSHLVISYAVFCLKKKKKHKIHRN